MIGKIITVILRWCGYKIQVDRISRKKVVPTRTSKINIGAADWYKDGWTNLDYPTVHYAKRQSKVPFISYDIRNDRLPFDNNTISLAYCSHVIEHIEDRYVVTLFEEVHRCLKEGGVFRITCPDASFLYDVTKSGQKSYWHWREGWFREYRHCEWQDVNEIDCLVAEIATDKCNFANKKEYFKKFEMMEKNEFLSWATNGLCFDNAKVGNHINFWTSEKIESMLHEAGFECVIISKNGGSVAEEMQDKKFFDVTHPEMSLYVDAVK